MKVRNRLIGIAAVIVAAGFCWQAASSAPNDDQDAELYRLFVDALEQVDRSYIKDVDRRDLVESAIAGMLSELDPYSNYIGPREWKHFDRATVGKFGGIGVQITMKDGVLTVLSPVVGTPAYEAGIIAGDRIVKVDGHVLRGLSLNDIVDKLTGEPDTELVLTIQRGSDNAKPFDVKLKRAIVAVESVLGDTHGTDDHWDFMLDEKDKIGYIRINSFIQNTAKDLRAAVDSLLKQGMKGLVLDLRYNPGGLLPAAIEVSDLFVDEGVIVSTKGRNTVEKTYYAEKSGTLPDFPMVVLVNQYSASASEIVSACLQDHKRAVVIGERTWGKGSVQNLIQLEGGKSALKLTTASYWRPSGQNIHRFEDSKEEDQWGVSPNEDFEVKFTAKDHNRYSRWRQERDRIVGKAKEGTVVAPPETDAQQAMPMPEAKADDAKPEPEAEKAKAEPAKEEAKPTTDEKPAEKAADEEKKPEKTPVEEVQVDIDEEVELPPKFFEDKQLNRAIAYLRAEIKGENKKDEPAEKAAVEDDKATKKAEAPAAKEAEKVGTGS